MLLLTSTSDKLQIVTGSTGTVDVHASWVDNNAGTITPGRTNTATITTAVTTDVVAPPAAATQRNVQTLNVRNRHATTSNLVTVKHTDGTNALELFAYTLLPGEVLQYLDGVGFQVFDAAGGKKSTGQVGRWLKTTVLTSGTTFTTTPSTTTLYLRMVGGGGAGAGCTSVAAAASAGGGGSAGGYAEKTFTVTPNTAYTYAIGAAGAGASGGAGGNGGVTTFAVGATTVTAQAGQGAPVATAVTTLSIYRGGTAATVSTNGDVNNGGEPGGAGVIVVVATPLGVSGDGGSGPLGAGGSSIAAVGNGNAGLGFGAGGGGAMTGASVVRTGGNGTAGAIIVDEFA
jgi:hypothetical protein